MALIDQSTLAVWLEYTHARDKCILNTDTITYCPGQQQGDLSWNCPVIGDFLSVVWQVEPAQDTYVPFDSNIAVF